jgi:hypothetical protein
MSYFDRQSNGRRIHFLEDVTLSHAISASAHFEGFWDLIFQGRKILDSLLLKMKAM